MAPWRLACRRRCPPCLLCLDCVLCVEGQCGCVVYVAGVSPDERCPLSSPTHLRFGIALVEPFVPSDALGKVIEHPLKVLTVYLGQDDALPLPRTTHQVVRFSFEEEEHIFVFVFVLCFFLFCFFKKKDQ